MYLDIFAILFSPIEPLWQACALIHSVFKLGGVNNKDLSTEKKSDLLKEGLFYSKIKILIYWGVNNLKLL